MIDRYSKIVLTVIAGALIYLCVVMTAFPAVQAQGTKRAGEMIATPIEAVIVGWKLNAPLPIARPSRCASRPSARAASRSRRDRRLGRRRHAASASVSAAACRLGHTTAAGSTCRTRTRSPTKRSVPGLLLLDPEVELWQTKTQIGIAGTPMWNCPATPTQPISSAEPASKCRNRATTASRPRSASARARTTRTRMPIADEAQRP